MKESILRCSISPHPNGSEIITVSAAGVFNIGFRGHNDSERAVVSNPVEVWVTFNDRTPAEDTGTYYGAKQGFELESSDEIEQAQVYVSGVCTLFVQYFK